MIVQIDSVIQDDWCDIAQRMRLAVAARIADIPAMKPEEIEKLVDAARSALWLEQNAITFDKNVELEMAKFSSTS